MHVESLYEYLVALKRVTSETNFVHYTRAPVTEAVIDIQAALETPPSIEALEDYSRSLAMGFPHVHRLNSFAVNISTVANEPDIQKSTSSSALGFRLSSPKNDRVLQVRKQGLALSHMPPYTNWEQFVGEMKPLWSAYAKSFGVSRVSRLAVRFINRIQIRFGEDIDTYVNVGAKCPDKISKYVIRYFSQLVVPIDGKGPEYKAIINTGLEGDGGGGESAGLLLDIDVFCEKELSIDGDNVWSALSDLRAQKNRLFEASITNKVREMIL